jgi:hypothetical protein
MANTDKVFGQGTQFALGSTTVAELTNISFPGFSSDDIDVTTHNSADYARQFIKGLTDAGEITLEGYFNYTDYVTMYAGQWTLSLYSATIAVPTKPSATKWLANVYVKGLEGSSPFDDKIEFSATCKITGKPSLTQV